ncbi:MAG: alpha/beta hydrolase [Marinoscillum sp.]|uniref:alpha/beta hydrolase n=2 Tax=Marinoscillum sp. TaxID=2024838 RepID=UPI0032FB5294
MMEERHIAYQHTTPYAVLNKLTKDTKRIWLVFHGYGQLSRYFLRKFEGLDPVENYIIAPQGISKTYLEGFSGRVGASWMTSEDRLTEIANQKVYIDAVIAAHQIDWADKRLVYFGFSQGVATMCRYAAHARLPFDQMILWAGMFPPELANKDYDFLNRKISVKYFTGSRDPFYETGMKEGQVSKVRAVLGVDAEVRTFDGVHEVRADLINAL